MAEYIGSRISLISKRDIRYVGTLHEISSENSTVALEQVKSYGTEGRSGEEVPASDNIYEYIVFRGSDVKDLRIEKEPEKKSVQPPQVPDDPAILGNARPIGARPVAPPQHQSSPQGPPQPQQQQQPYSQQGRGQHPRYPNQSPFPYGGYPPPPNQRFGPYGGPQGLPPHGYPGMQYGPPPGWYPPPGHGLPHGPPGHPLPPHMQPGFPPQPPDQRGTSPKSATPADQISSVTPLLPQQPAAVEKPAATVKLPSSTSPTVQSVRTGPPPPTDSKPDVAAALAPPAPSVASNTAAPTNGQKSGRIRPAIPMLSPGMKAKAPVNGVLPSTSAGKPAINPPHDAVAKEVASHPAQTSTKSLEDANRDARAAVAAAMAKLPPVAGQQSKLVKQTNGENIIDNLTSKVNEMRTSENARTSRQPGTGGYAAGNRGGRGAYRGGRPRTESQTKKMEVPKTDYDFESANARFNKQDLVKEVIAGGDTISSPINGTSDSHMPSGADGEQNLSPTVTAGYNKTSSFFDNISSEARDREDYSGKRLGGREFRNEEQKKNIDTFGQSSVDSYRGGYRGRGRGRGFRGGRGSFGRGGRGGLRGRGGGAVATEG